MGKTNGVTFTLKFTKETKNTFRFDKPEGVESSPSDSLYVAKSAFDGKAPPAIKVTVEPTEL